MSTEAEHAIDAPANEENGAPPPSLADEDGTTEKPREGNGVEEAEIKEAAAEKDPASSAGEANGDDLILFNSLSKGFATLLKRRDGKDGSHPEDTTTENACVLVNFIDPTTPSEKSGPDNSPQKLGLLGQLSNPKMSNEKFLSLNLYKKLTFIFEREFSSNLNSVAYENVRNGAAGVIESLKVQHSLMQSGSGGMASGDPSEWHKGAFCHVYIAACESLDHYKSKVKPALQAFVSQIEGPASSGLQAALPRRSNSDDTLASGSSYSPHYVIVYVPLRTSSSQRNLSASSDGGRGSRIGGFASRVAAARRQMASSRDLGDSVHSQATNGTDGTDPDVDSSDLSVASTSGPVTPLSKLEKDIYKKFTTDFPNGNTCIMSTLMEPTQEEVEASPLKNQEWSTFLRFLGVSIVSGFKDRCRRYDEELRRLDAQRASVNTGDSKSLSSKAVGRRFDFRIFFCVKESLAFTYEQMRLPSEALLQYEELRAFVPEVASAEGQERVRADKKAKSLSWRKALEFEQETMKYAIAGSAAEFRRNLRAADDITYVSQVISQYILAREISLLLQMGEPVAIMKRALSFVQNSYQLRKKGLLPSQPIDDKDDPNERADAELWSLKFCWDVKRACGVYLTAPYQEEGVGESLVNEEGDASNQTAAQKADESDGNKVAVSAAAEKEAIIQAELARSLSELLEFARLRFLCLGDIELSGGNPVRDLAKFSPLDLKKPWLPWDSIVGTEEEPERSEVDDTSAETKDHMSIVEGALDSPDAYEDKYLILSASVVMLCRFAGRLRTASRLQGEIAEIYIRRGDWNMAAKKLAPTVNIPALDQWDRGHYWRLFRLACCQRMIKQAAPYLNTLTRCFGRRLTPVAPVEASELLYRDLETVISDPLVAEFRLGVAPFLDMELKVEATSTDKSPAILENVRKRVVQNLCSVGEKSLLLLTITSHLPRSINVDSLSLCLVPFDEYEPLLLSKGSTSEEDAFRTLSMPAPITIKPGSNSFTFEWIPMNTGRYIVSSVPMQWKHARFYYDCVALRQPLMGLNIVASEPTHSVELNPLFLIPGHVQQVRIVFHAGADVIRSGTVQLECSGGLEVVPPGTDSKDGVWGASCEIELPACRPGETVVLTTSVKSNVVESIEHKLGLDTDARDASSGNIQTMRAIVTTAYHHKLYETTKDKDDATPSMKSVLEATVTTLDGPALTVDSTDVYDHSEDSVLLSVNLHCNTPDPFSIKEWAVKLPKFQVTPGGDLNEGMFGHAISEGDQVCFGFVLRSETSHAANSDGAEQNSILHIVLQDQFGKTFDQVLPLDLSSFIEQSGRSDEFSGFNNVTCELKCSATEGFVGAPVTLSYHVDIAALDWPQRQSGDDDCLLYRVSCNASDWILGGNVQGVLRFDGRKNAKLDFIGIPTNPGVIKSFPAITLVPEGGDSAPINVNTQHPESFKSLSFVNHMALACPTDVEG